MRNWLGWTLFSGILIAGIGILIFSARQQHIALSGGQGPTPTDNYANDIADNGDFVHTEDLDRATIRAVYPRTNIELLDADFQEFVRRQVAFFKEALAADTTLTNSILEIDYTTSKSEDLITFVFSVREKFGDESDVTYYKSFTYDREGAYTSLDDIFTVNDDFLSLIQERSRASLVQAFGDSIPSGRLDRATDPSGRTYELFRAQDDSIRFIIPGYKLEDGDSTSYEVPIQLDDVAEYIRIE